MPRTRLILLLLLCSLLLGSKSEAFDIRVLLATVALGIIGMAGRYIVQRDRSLIRFEDRVDGALWGPMDANGKRNVEAGIVAVANRLAADLPRAVAAAESAARSAELAADRVQEATRRVEEASGYAIIAGDAARTAQDLLREQLHKEG